MTSHTRIIRDPIPGMVGELKTMKSRQKSPPVAAWFKQTVGMYSAETRVAFNTNSRGGGAWPPLKPSTIRARADAARNNGKSVGGKAAPGIKAEVTKKKRKKKVTVGRVYAILKDTGQLFNALEVGAPGNSVEDIDGGVRYGFATTPHARRSAKGGVVTVAQLVYWHHTGAGHNPVRRILNDPSDDLKKRMKAAGVQMVQKLVEDSEGKK